MSRVSNDAKRKLNVCQFCGGYGRHTCTSFTCSEAVKKAEGQYRKERSRYMSKEFKGSDNKEYYGKTVMEALHEVLEVEQDADIDSIRRMYSLDEILDAVLVYEGMLGYSEMLIRIIEEIFGVNLLEIDV